MRILRVGVVFTAGMAAISFFGWKALPNLQDVVAKPIVDQRFLAMDRPWDDGSTWIDDFHIFLNLYGNQDESGEPLPFWDFWENHLQELIDLGNNNPTAEPQTLIDWYTDFVDELYVHCVILGFPDPYEEAVIWGRRILELHGYEVGDWTEDPPAGNNNNGNGTGGSGGNGGSGGSGSGSGGGSGGGGGPN